MKTLSYASKTKAIKDHKCNFCDEIISKGDSYTKSTHKYDGQVYDWKTHALCNWIASKLNMYEDAEEGLTGDAFMETISCNYFELLTANVDDKHIIKYKEIISALRYVKFKEKLSYVISHYRRIEFSTSPQ